MLKLKLIETEYLNEDHRILAKFTETFVKLQSKVQTSVLGLGVDFVLPLSQQEQQQEQEQQPHQNIPELGIQGG